MDLDETDTLLTNTQKTETLTSASSFERELVLAYSDSDASELIDDDLPIDDEKLPTETNRLTSDDSFRRVPAENRRLDSTENSRLTGNDAALSSGNGSPISVGIVDGLISEPTIEHLMTEEEIRAWDQRLQDCSDRLKAHMEEHVKWVSNLDSRKQRLATRLKKLQEQYTNRRHLYACVEEYLIGTKTQQPIT